jgi:prepilin-type N-terminal cleavage/methylation domain-containing protein
MRTARRSSSGVTLIELLIVLSLMGILAAAVIPSATPTLREQLAAAARLAAADAAYCRSLAVTNNDHYRLRFDIEQNKYFIEPGDRPAVELNDLPTVGPRVALYKIEAGGKPVGELEFGPLGETSEETVIWLACGQGPDRLYQAVRVDPVTGLTWIEKAVSDPPSAAGGEGNQPRVY